MNEETLRILEMVKNGKITPEEGEKLLSAIGLNEPAQKKKGVYSMLHVRVDAAETDKAEQTRVNVNIPLSIAKKVMGLVSLMPKEAKEELIEKGIDIDAVDLKGLIEMFEDGEITEELVNVAAGDTTVRVYVD